mmetsp:Transcript_27326/g.90834  ORF Transcript_27326/g.90834 Transcript_27326/m.90834 type:complete len:97 (+) Transcript_27326:49-339(+)
MTLTADEVKKMTVPKLRAALEERGLDTSGLKAALADRLLQALAAPAADAEAEQGAAAAAAAAMTALASPATAAVWLGKSYLVARGAAKLLMRLQLG